MGNQDNRRNISEEYRIDEFRPPDSTSPQRVDALWESPSGQEETIERATNQQKTDRDGKAQPKRGPCSFDLELSNPERLSDAHFIPRWLIFKADGLWLYTQTILLVLTPLSNTKYIHASPRMTAMGTDCVKTPYWYIIH